jgi:hypothetical protein
MKKKSKSYVAEMLFFLPDLKCYYSWKEEIAKLS